MKGSRTAPLLIIPPFECQLKSACTRWNMYTHSPFSLLPFHTQNSPLLRSATGLRKKAAAANAALHAEVRELSERVEVLAASSKRREKAQSVRDKASALARSMEIKRIQV